MNLSVVHLPLFDPPNPVVVPIIPLQLSDYFLLFFFPLLTPLWYQNQTPLEGFTAYEYCFLRSVLPIMKIAKFS